MESRITQRSGVSGLTSTSYCFPFTVSEIINGLLSRRKLPHSRLIANLDLSGIKNTDTQRHRGTKARNKSLECAPLCLCVFVSPCSYSLLTSDSEGRSGVL